MELLVGAAAVLAGVLLYAWAYGKHHGVNAPGWAKTQLFASSISLIVTGFAPVGIGYIVAGLINAAGQSVVSWAALAALMRDSSRGRQLIRLAHAANALASI